MASMAMYNVYGDMVHTPFRKAKATHQKPNTLNIVVEKINH